MKDVSHREMVHVHVCVGEEHMGVACTISSIFLCFKLF